jgi:AraC-like DNA-binding protein
MPSLHTLLGASPPAGPAAQPALPPAEHIVGGMAAIPALLKARGVDPGALLSRVGLAVDALDSPDRRVPFAAAARLLWEAAQETRCPHFGLLVGEHYTFGKVGLPGQLALCSATVGEALETFAVYQRLNSQGGAVYFKRYAASAEFGFAIFHPRMEALAPAYDLSIASQVSGVRELCGPGWNPEAVLLPRACPDDERPYRQYFRCPVVFDADHAALRFSATVLEQRLTTADPVFRRTLEREITMLPRDALAVQLYRSLRLVLLDGGTRAGPLAEQWAMHRRTLQRHLKGQGITFRTVLDEVRYDAARQLLSDTALPAAEIAQAVGFAEPSSFTHAFKRWSGRTPAQWRADWSGTPAELRFGGSPVNGLPAPARS